jgi:hypothetical protein
MEIKALYKQNIIVIIINHDIKVAPALSIMRKR